MRGGRSRRVRCSIVDVVGVPDIIGVADVVGVPDVVGIVDVAVTRTATARGNSDRGIEAVLMNTITIWLNIYIALILRQ